jgi:hypothetical protein
MAREIKSISVTREFSMLAEKTNCSWTEAARIGMSIMLAEKGEMEYDNKLNLYRKMNLFRKEAENALQKISELETKQSIEKIPLKTEIEKEMKKVLE